MALHSDMRQIFSLSESQLTKKKLTTGSRTHPAANQAMTLQDTQVPIGLLLKAGPSIQRSESKKREDEPAQADQEDLGHGSRAASEGQHHAKLQLKQGGMEAKLSRGTQALGTCLTLSYPRPCCHPHRGWQSRASVTPGRGKDWLPPTAVGRDRQLRCCHLTGEAKERRCGPKASLWAPPLSTSWKCPKHLGTRVLPGVAHSVWLPSPDTEFCILLFCPLSSTGALGR